MVAFANESFSYIREQVIVFYRPFLINIIFFITWGIKIWFFNLSSRRASVRWELGKFNEQWLPKTIAKDGSARMGSWHCITVVNCPYLIFFKKKNPIL